MDVFYDGLLSNPRLDHPEGIAVHPDGSVWCGGERGQIFRIADGEIEQIASTDGFCLGIAFDSALNLYVCDLAHRAVFRLDTRTGALSTFADGADGRRFISPNFPAVDDHDRVYVSDNGIPHEPGPGVYRFEPSGAGTLWHPGPFNFANGMAFSADYRTLYVATTWARQIVAIDIHDDGTPGDTRVVVDLPGMLPDGIAVGEDGQLYVGCYEPSRVLCVDPADGTWSTVADDPDAHVLCHPTNVAFHDDVLLTANLGRWHISRIPVSTTGARLPQFAKCETVLPR